MATGDTADILTRVKALIPFRWFSSSAPLRDAIVGGLSDISAWCYSWIAFARQQSRLATSTGVFLDILAFDFLGRYLKRNSLSDDAFRAKTKATILQERVTRSGMTNALTILTGTAPKIFEPWNTGDCGAYGFAMGYGCAGCYGSLQFPGQAFIMAMRPNGQGVPNVAGYGDPQAGYGVGVGDYISQSQVSGPITDNEIYAMADLTKPTGVIAWVDIVSAFPVAPPDSSKSITADTINYTADDAVTTTDHP